MPVRASAPGKVILMGEHSVVYGAPALVGAVDLRVDVELTPVAALDRQASGVSFVLDDTASAAAAGAPLRLSWSEILQLSVQAREAWSAGGAVSLESLTRLSGEQAFLVVALGEASRLLAGASQGSIEFLPELQLRVASEIPIGAGMGSSAAVAVAVVGALAGSAGWVVKFEVIDAVALDIERRQHGRPSGIDHSTVLRGGVLWFEASKTGFDVEWMIEPLDLDQRDFAQFHLFKSGRPENTTGETVAAVARYLESQPTEFERVLGSMEEATRQFRQALVERADPRPSMRTFQRCLEQIGVVPDRVRDLVRRVERKGGAAKISGAGAITGSGGGALLVYHPEATSDTIALWLDDCEHTSAALGAEGLSIVVGP
jgi:mevalonate kinase